VFDSGALGVVSSEAAVIDRGKYNDLCEEIRQRAGAAGCVIIVFDG